VSTELDPLTGLPNRRQFMAELDREVRRGLRHRRALAVAIYDLDGFRHVNDRAGHLAGDDALRRVAGVFRDVARATDGVARMGGDEFAAVFPATSLDDALWICDLAQQRVALLPAYADVRLSIAYGVAELQLGDSAADLLRRADFDLGERQSGGACTAGVREPRRPRPSAGRPSLRLLPGGAEGSDPEPET
jgi:diguanylate cyclase (GGDEF)-like protein